ncbi:hypothetical protein NLG97_g1013 [Lecanicillium saksenae]|uniref:Uncharacterized protein n=1 Tax=Lecanicillium saksenae TaxID=468837 RepID=A0ACC1R8F0_9HYPO|nr:hypothetical protein NLG97_g1013 [Lecanicillium saksenae]
MSSHGVPRTEGDRSPEQLKKELEKIDKYRVLENQLRAQQKNTTNPPPLQNSAPSNADENPADASLSPPPSAESNENGPQPYRPVTNPHDTKPTQTEDKGEELDIGQYSETIRDELMFTVPLLMGHPKCYWIWNYRMWILEQATSMLPVVAAKSIWKEELGLVSKMLSRDRRNYHAWAYRRYVVSHLESTKLDGQSMAEAEFSYTKTMIENDLSNFSAWHNRAQLIPRLLKERNADDASRRVFLDKEFEMVDNGLNVGPEDQSLWYYHQYLTWNVADQPEDLSILPNTETEDRVRLITQEIDFIKDLLEDYKDVKWIYEMLLEYTLLIRKLGNKSFNSEQNTELEGWIAIIKRLDPQRSNRWEVLAKELKVSA